MPPDVYYTMGLGTAASIRDPTFNRTLASCPLSLLCYLFWVYAQLFFMLFLSVNIYLLVSKKNRNYLCQY